MILAFSFASNKMHLIPPIDAAPVVPAVDIDQTVDHWDEILHFDDVDDDVLPEL